MSSNLNLVITPDGLLVGNGRVAIVAIETSTGATRWSADIYDPEIWARACALARHRARDRAALLRKHLGRGRSSGSWRPVSPRA